MSPECDGAAMIHRKGESTKADLRRRWPHHVVLPADKLRGLMNSEIVRTAAVASSATPQTYSVRRGDLDFVMFCFTKPVNADVFSERFGGKRLTYSLGPQRRCTSSQ
jgi:hypothetical protein